MVGALPKDLDWNKQYLSELLDGARAILMPPKADVALVDIAWFLISHGGELSLPRGQTLEDRPARTTCAPASSRRAIVSAAMRATTAPTFPSAPPCGCSRICGRSRISPSREPRNTIENLAMASVFATSR